MILDRNFRVFEDHASFVFLNRRLPVPKFDVAHDGPANGGVLTIKTDALELKYAVISDGQFLLPQSLSITLTVDGKQVIWHPGMTDPENLREPRALWMARWRQNRRADRPGPGFALRLGAGRRLHRPLFDSSDFRFLHGEKSPWPWVMERPAGERRLRTGTSSATATTTPRLSATMCGLQAVFRCRRGLRLACGGRATGRTATRSSTSSCSGFRENDTPLDVLVIDMDWHISHEQLEAMGESINRAKSSAGPATRGTSFCFPILIIS